MFIPRYLSYLMLLQMEVCPWKLFQCVCCWCTERMVSFTSWYCTLPLCWNRWLFSRHYLMKCLGSLMYSIMSFADWDNSSSYPIYIPSISFSYLIALATVSNTLLKRREDSGQFCLLPNFNGIITSFSSFWRNIGWELYTAFIILTYIISYTFDGMSIFW